MLSATEGLFAFLAFYLTLYQWSSGGPAAAPCLRGSPQALGKADIITVSIWFASDKESYVIKREAASNSKAIGGFFCGLAAFLRLPQLGCKKSCGRVT